MTGERWNRNEIIVDDIFAYHVAQNVANENEDLEPMSMEECRHREDWPKWKEAIDCELKSLAKRKVFGPVVLMPYGIKHVGYNSCENEMRIMKLLGIKHDWLPKGSHKDLVLIMKRHILLWWMP